MFKLLGFVLGVLVSAIAFAGPVTSAPAASEEDTFAKIMKVIVSNSSRPNLRLNGDLNLTSKECLFDEGFVIKGDLFIINTLKFDLSKPGTDPMNVLIMEAANNGLKLNTTTTIGKNCSYNIYGEFKQAVLTGRMVKDKNGNLRREVTDIPSNLILNFQMGLTGQFLSFRVESMKAKFETVAKGNKGVKEYVFNGKLKAEQEMADFMSLDLAEPSKQGVSTPSVVSWEPIDAEIVFSDGQFKIRMGGQSKLPTKK